MKTEELRDGTDGVRGIRVSAVPTTGAIQCGGRMVSGNQRTSIVKIRTFAMGNRPENATAVHVECGQCKPIVATVFGHETMSLRSFRRTHQLPTVGHRRGSRHFDRHMFSTAHRLDGHSGVVAPIGTYIYKVYVLTATKFAPRLRVCRSFGQWAPLLAQQFECRRDRCGIGIGHRTKFRSIDIGIARQGGSSALPGADQPDAHRGNRRTSQLENRRSVLHENEIFAHEDTNFGVEKTAECSFSQLFWSKACKIGEYCLLLHCV